MSWKKKLTTTTIHFIDFIDNSTIVAKKMQRLFLNMNKLKLNSILINLKLMYSNPLKKKLRLKEIDLKSV